MSLIVVGVDGSPSSQEALRWATREARLRGAGIRAVHAWEFPYHDGEIARLAGETIHEPLVRAANQLLDTALRDADLNGITVERVVTEGPAARALLQEAEGAELLVVGCRGHGGFAGLLLGSVSQQCAQHAGCPVVIVRHPVA